MGLPSTDRRAIAALEIWPETPILPKQLLSQRRLSMKQRALKRISCITVPYKTEIRLLGVAQNSANGFPARVLGLPLVHSQFLLLIHLGSCRAALTPVGLVGWLPVLRSPGTLVMVGVGCPGGRVVGVIQVIDVFHLIGRCQRNPQE